MTLLKNNVIRNEACHIRAIKITHKPRENKAVSAKSNSKSNSTHVAYCSGLRER